MKNIHKAIICNKAPEIQAPCIVVSGTWLRANGIAREWYDIRQISTWSFVPDGVEDGEITNEFKDVISINQAKECGLISRL